MGVHVVLLDTGGEPLVPTTAQQQRTTAQQQRDPAARKAASTGDDGSGDDDDDDDNDDGSGDGDARAAAAPALAVGVGGVRNGPVPGRGGDTAGAPLTATAKSLKRPARTSGSMAPELLEKYQNWRLLLPGRKHAGELRFPYPKNGSFRAYGNIDQVLDADAFYTDATSCAMDPFNLGVNF